jgi:hypothetical protein
MRLNFDIVKDIYEEFAKNCKKQGRTMSDVMRTLIIDWNAKMRREDLQILRSKEVKDDRSDCAG